MCFSLRVLCRDGSSVEFISCFSMDPGGQPSPPNKKKTARFFLIGGGGRLLLGGRDYRKRRIDLPN